MTLFLGDCVCVVVRASVMAGGTIGHSKGARTNAFCSSCHILDQEIKNGVMRRRRVQI